MRNEKFFSRRIEKLAFKLYKARGNAPGSEKDDWLKAERLVKSSFTFRFVTLLERLIKPLVFLVIVCAAAFFLGVLARGVQDKLHVRQGNGPEQGDRPHVEIELKRIDIVKKELGTGQLPEMRFVFEGKLFNYGKAPAYVKNVEFFLKDIEMEEFAPVVLRPREGQKQGRSLDLESGVRKTFMWEPTIDLVSIEAIMRAYVDDKNVNNKKGAFWKKRDREIADEFKKRIQPFSLIAQVEYYAVDDKELKKPYYYSLQCKVDRQLNCFYYKCAKTRWLKISDTGVISRIP